MKIKLALAALLATVVTSFGFLSALIAELTIGLLYNFLRTFYSLFIQKEKWSWVKAAVGVLRILIFCGLIFASSLVSLHLPPFTSFFYIVTFMILFSEAYNIFDTLGDMKIVKVSLSDFGIIAVMRKILKI